MIDQSIETDLKAKKKEAEQFAADDKRRRDEIETINQADSVVYSTKKLLEEMRGKIGSDKEERIRKGISELEELLKPEKKDTAKTARKALITRFLYLKPEAEAQLTHCLGEERTEP